MLYCDVVRVWFGILAGALVQDAFRKRTAYSDDRYRNMWRDSVRKHMNTQQLECEAV